MISKPSWEASAVFPVRCRSLTTTSNSSSIPEVSPALAFLAVSTAWPTFSSAFFRESPTFSSSSTIRILGMALRWCFVNWQHDAKRGSLVELGVELNISPMLGNDPLRDGQTQSGSAVLGAEKGIEQVGSDVVRNTRARVLDLDRYHVDFLPIDSVFVLTRSQGDGSLALNTVRPIADQIDENLLELPRISPKFRFHGGFHRQLDLPLLQRPSHQFLHLTQQRIRRNRDQS